MAVGLLLAAQNIGDFLVDRARGATHGCVVRDAPDLGGDRGVDINGAGQVERTFEIVNNLGLHACAAALLVQSAQKYESHVEVSKDDIVVRPITDETKVGIAGIVLFAWVVFWIGATVRSVFGKRA